MDETSNKFNDILSECSSSAKQENLGMSKDAGRKVLHFSDGIMEVCEAEEQSVTESDGQQQEAVPAVDPSTLSWGPWIWHKTVSAGTTTLNVFDYMGEGLANFFGITTPKYQFEIDEYNRMVEEEEREKKQMDLEMGGWADDPSKLASDQTTDQPKSSLPVEVIDSGQNITAVENQRF